MSEPSSLGAPGSPSDLFSPGLAPDQQRAALAAWVKAHEAEIRGVARRKLTRGTRLIFDSEEVFSSVMRRLDGMAVEGTLKLNSESELKALVRQIARNTAISKTRLIERMRDRLTEDGPYAYEMLRRLNACRDDDEAAALVHRMARSLKGSDDRQILHLLLLGASHRVVGQVLGIRADAGRQRWARVRQELTQSFAQGALDG